MATSTISLPPGVELGEEVREALEFGHPLVALESAVISHGLPSPANLDAVRAMEEAIRDKGAVPAVCLIHDGVLWIGADRRRIEAVAGDPAREKASVRDLGALLASGISAGLTVSATLFAASIAGLKVFATGGIGGVHRGATETGDVSADLLQLSRSRLIVVCAGAKSVLDIPRTLEFLETVGVPVFTYRTESFPAFYLRDSGVSTPMLRTAGEIARVARTQWDLGYQGGMVIGNPLPETKAIGAEDWQRWIEEAHGDAISDRIAGKAVTPYLLDRVATLSGGRTVEVNLALLENNAALAAEIAVALAS